MYSLGIDIGGTKIAAGIYDENHVLIHREQVSTPTSATAIDAQLASMYRAAKAEVGKIEAIGISAAGNVGSDRRTMLFSANIAAWVNYPLADRLSALIDNEVPVIVENDANSAGWGEYIAGAGKGSTNMVMLTVGTGLGGAFVLDNKLYRGSFGMAAEVGHLPMVPDGETCGCGLRGCAEKYISGTALERFARAAVRRNPQKGARLLELAGGDIDAIRGEMVSQAATEGDELGLYAFNKIGEWLGRTMAAIAAVLDPDRFVIGGGVVSIGDILLTPARKNYVRFLQAAAYRPHAEILTASAGNDAGMMGVADLALRETVELDEPSRQGKKSKDSKESDKDAKKDAHHTKHSKK
jgi:glucokinase